MRNLFILFTFISLHISAQTNVELKSEFIAKTIELMQKDSLIKQLDTILVFNRPDINHSGDVKLMYIDYADRKFKGIKDFYGFDISYEFRKDHVVIFNEIWRLRYMEGSAELVECNGSASIYIRYNCATKQFQFDNIHFDIGGCDKYGK